MCVYLIYVDGDHRTTCESWFFLPWVLGFEFRLPGVRASAFTYLHASVFQFAILINVGWKLRNCILLMGTNKTTKHCTQAFELQGSQV